MKKKTVYLFAATVVALVFTGMAITAAPQAKDEESAVARPALTVTLATPELRVLPLKVSANGDIMAWQEASIGTEAGGLRLDEVRVNVGDRVQRGQVVATFAADTVNAEFAQSRAATAEALAALSEATANAQRARGLQETGAMSAQQIHQYVTAEHTARARLEAARAAEKMQRLRLAQTRVLAPDDGVISARSATVGAVLPAGQELFRIIRGNRLEWRAEVAAEDLTKLKIGQVVHITLIEGEVIAGSLRMVSPVIDTQTRNAMVYVDLPQPGIARAGMFARGEFETGAEPMLTLPQTSVLQRDGFSHVFRLDEQSRVIQTRITIGRRSADRVEILGGLDPSVRVVEAGGSFLGDGDLVRVVTLGSAGEEGMVPGSDTAPIIQK